MSRRKSTAESIGIGMSAKQMRRKKPINSDCLLTIEPKTENQKKLFQAYNEGKHLFIHGCAGTGKTFCSLYLALREVLSEFTYVDKVYIVRSLVPTREIGFLPGSEEDKQAVYQIPYKNMVRSMFDLPDDPSFEMLYGNLKQQETIKFWSTSFLRGTTLDNAIIIVDESQNLSMHELDSIITRLGEHSRIIFSGDTKQSDLTKQSERNGINDFMSILKQMSSFEMIEFGIEDIVRSGLVKEYLTVKHNSGF
jgi:phosphate starvation-inducible protein PhoH